MVHRAIGVLTVCLAALASLPAIAADRSTIRCPRGELSGPDRDNVLGMVRGEMDGRGYIDLGHSPLHRAVATCATRHGWNNAEKRAAFIFNLNDIAADLYRQESWDSASIDRIFAGLSAADRDSIGRLEETVLIRIGPSVEAASNAFPRESHHRQGQRHPSFAYALKLIGAIQQEYLFAHAIWGGSMPEHD